MHAHFRAMGTIGVREINDRSYALRGNAAQDAPRPTRTRTLKPTAETLPAL